MHKEVWKDIKGYEGKYQISNQGRVKSLGRKQWNGVATWMSEDRIKTPCDVVKGYKGVVLYNGSPKSFRIHRLVANAFIPKKEKKLQINHKNGDKSDNRVENLEWCTEEENKFHAFNTGIGANKLSVRDVLEIRNKYKVGDDCKKIGKKYNVGYSCIRRLLKGETWNNAQIV